LNLRAASELVRTASNFKSQVVIKKDGFPSDGKSLIGLISLAIVYGSKLRVSIQGEDAREAWDAISSLARRNFGEKQ
jgi:phosphotransferase system HPr (HPr) family protein